jgi:ATP-dependent RNA helicase DOB1
VIPVSLALLDGMSSIRVYIPKEVKSNESRQIVSKSLREVQKRFVDGIPLLDPIEDMKIEDASFKKLIRVIH